MTRGELRQELYDLGHNYLELEPGRGNRFLDQGAQDILLDEPWPQRRVTNTMLPADTLATLGTIKQVWVTTTGQTLDPMTIDELRDTYGAETTWVTGVPTYFYVVQNRQVLTYPASASDALVTVDHLSKGCWEESASRYFSAPSDNSTLIGDGLFDEAVLLASRLRVLEDTDETGLREDIGIRLERELVGLRDRELNPVADEPTRIKQTGDWA